MMGLFFRNRQVAGNICLIVFLAFMFTLIPGQLWTSNAYATSYTNPTIFADNDTTVSSSNTISTQDITITPTTGNFADTWNLFIGKLLSSDLKDLVYKAAYQHVYGVVYQIYLTYNYTYGTTPNNSTESVYVNNDGQAITIPVSVWRPPTKNRSNKTTTTEYVGPKDIANHWANKEISKLVSMGVVTGYPDGNFYPEKKVTRAEFAALVVRALKLNSSTTKLFDDVSLTEWYADEISSAYIAGIIKGYGKAFKPNQVISREEMAAMVARALTYKKNLTAVGTTEGNDLIAKFGDKQKVADWAKQDLATLLKEQVILGRTDNTLDPTGLTTRAESAVLVYRILNRLGQL